jgi:hypothetical protein
MNAKVRERYSRKTMSKERDIAYGRHSRLPECCIQFFVGGQWEREMKSRSLYYEAVQLSDYNYVPCVPCFATQTKVRMVDCLKDCGRECWKDFR